MAKRRTRSSRLSRYAEKQSRKQFLLFGLGTIVIIFLLIQFSGVILNLFGDLIFGIRGEEENSSVNGEVEEILLPPTLRDLPNATASAEINISGTSIYTEGEVILYVNNTEADDLNLEGNDFRFTDVRLQNGENTLQVRYVLGDRESDKSEVYNVLRSSEKPELEISNPADNSTFTKADKRINVSGKTDPTNIVTVNGFRAVVEGNGEYSYLLELNEGDNTINVEATNEAGVKTSEEIKVIYRSE